MYLYPAVTFSKTAWDKHDDQLEVTSTAQMLLLNNYSEEKIEHVL